jgi:hypothetical protein
LAVAGIAALAISLILSVLYTSVLYIWLVQTASIRILGSFLRSVLSSFQPWCISIARFRHCAFI